MGLAAAHTSGSAETTSAPNTRQLPSRTTIASPNTATKQLSTPPKIANYVIEATLDTSTQVVSARATIRWTNPSALATRELYLHAYLNAFRNERSRFMRDTRSSRRSEGALLSPGELRVHRLIAEELGAVDLWPLRDPHSPGDPQDDTDIRIALPQPIEGGASLTLVADFEAKLPLIVERAGHVDGFYAVTQWFPKLARRTEAGEFRHFAYAALAEFSADFGDYDVTIDVPKAYVVAASGTETPLPSHPDRKRLRFRLENAHDFAWFAWNQFVERTETVAGVTIRHFAASSQSANAEVSLETVRWAIPLLSETFFPYPYGSLVIVHPPDVARAAGGMEYPGLFTTGGPWFLATTPTRFIESLTIHELAHQWFYGAVASDEYLHPVLDEGVTSFVEAWALRKHFGDGSLLSSSWLDLSEAIVRRTLARKYNRGGPLARSAVQFTDFATLSGEVYARFATLLETLGNVYGAERLLATLGDYARKHRFSHPTPADFVDSISMGLGAEAAATMSTALFAQGWVDYAVKTIELSASNSPPDVDSRTTGARSNAPFHNRLLLERRGTLDFPITVEVTLDDGHVLRQELNHLPASSWLGWDTARPIVRATLDPDERITIDDDLENQTFCASARKEPTRLLSLFHSFVTTALGLLLP